MARKTVAIAGLGAAARTIHLPACAKIRDIEVVGGCDPAARKENFRFPLFGSLDEMLVQAKPDILVIATPPAQHFDLTCTALHAGCHVFCEKPFMPTVAEAMKIVDLSRQTGRWVVVNNQYRFMNIHSEAKKRIGRPEFGQLRFLSVRQTFHMTPDTEAGWRGADRKRRTCIEFGTHVLDLCRFFFGEDPGTITARMPKGDNPDGPDLLNLLLLEFSGDRVAHIVLNRISRGPHRYLQMHLDGSNGCIETSLGGGIEFAVGIRGGVRRPHMHFDVSMGGRARIYHGEKFTKIASDSLNVFADATTRLLQAFLQALEDGSEPPCHADDNRRSLALMLAAYESQEKAAPVEMKY